MPGTSILSGMALLGATGRSSFPSSMGFTPPDLCIPLPACRVPTERAAYVNSGMSWCGVEEEGGKRDGLGGSCFLKTVKIWRREKRDWEHPVLADGAPAGSATAIVRHLRCCRLRWLPSRKRDPLARETLSCNRITAHYWGWPVP